MYPVCHGKGPRKTPQPIPPFTLQRGSSWVVADISCAVILLTSKALTSSLVRLHSTRANDRLSPFGPMAQNNRGRPVSCSSPHCRRRTVAFRVHQLTNTSPLRESTTRQHDVSPPPLTLPARPLVSGTGKPRRNSGTRWVANTQLLFAHCRHRCAC